MLGQVNNQTFVTKPTQKRRHARTTSESEGAQHPKKHLLKAK